MSYEQNPQKETATIADMTATGDKLTFTPAFPSEIVEFGIVVTTALVDTGGDGLVIKVDSRPTAGSDVGRGDGDVGTLTLTKAQAEALTAGKVARCRVPFSGGTPGSQPSNEIYPGQQAVLELTNAVATSGAAIAFIIHKHRPQYRDAVDTVVTS